MDEVVKDLKAKDVKFFKEPKNEPFGKHAIIVNPDGHLISIAEIHSTKSGMEFKSYRIFRFRITCSFSIIILSSQKKKIKY